MEENYRVIITGGPGSGKSSLISELQSIGQNCFEEVSRQVIQDQQAKGGSLLPWKDLIGFAALNIEKMIQHYVKGEGGVSFFDRGLPDIPAYFKFNQQALPPSFSKSIQSYRYCSTVFICPPWEEIYVNDAERPESFQDSCKIYQHLMQSYQNHGYQLVQVPCNTLQKRVEFILSNVKPFGLLPLADKRGKQVMG